MRKPRLALLMLILTAICLFSYPGAFAQCAMCKTALTGSPEGQKVARGFNNAILFLLSAPFFLFGTVAFLFYRARQSPLLAPRQSSFREKLSRLLSWYRSHKQNED